MPQTLRMLPVVKAYPVVDHVSFSEAVCVAGITFEEPRRWVRLFPLDFRGLERARQFRKYEAISLRVNPASFLVLGLVYPKQESVTQDARLFP